MENALKAFYRWGKYSHVVGVEERGSKYATDVTTKACFFENMDEFINIYAVEVGWQNSSLTDSCCHMKPVAVDVVPADTAEKSIMLCDDDVDE